MFLSLGPSKFVSSVSPFPALCVRVLLSVQVRIHTPRIRYWFYPNRVGVVSMWVMQNCIALCAVMSYTNLCFDEILFYPAFELEWYLSCLFLLILLIWVFTRGEDDRFFVSFVTVLLIVLCYTNCPRGQGWRLKKKYTGQKRLNDIWRWFLHWQWSYVLFVKTKDRR